MFYTKLLKIILQAVTNIIWSLFSFVVLEYLIILGLYTRGFFMSEISILLDLLFLFMVN